MPAWKGPYIKFYVTDEEKRKIKEVAGDIPLSKFLKKLVLSAIAERMSSVPAKVVIVKKSKERAA